VRVTFICRLPHEEPTFDTESKRKRPRLSIPRTRCTRSQLIPAEVVKAFPQAVLNIHPALLPAFGGKGYYGMNVHRAVVASGARCAFRCDSA
jgi:hypothetical protein